ncbi:hypothetical protein C7974DRAFT_379660 [Boeremia exigua]|uniref:uncharacterized protein n=1 Tax=Boeremia exigua TaxID=749465 RepID=UPI001E8CB0D0|nr:uncharacterized protein C7974DRAFT_379660 [Boeremia exigua]KAH6616815.1 hypothetical protein C7974DRAFT_379660 [Boeremia exigua]
MNSLRTLALAAVAGAGVTAEAMYDRVSNGEVIEMLPRGEAEGICPELPNLCTAPAMMYGYATTVTYVCPETSKVREPSTVHVTITKTTTVTPTSAEPTPVLTSAPSVVAPPVQSEEPDSTTTVHTTKTEYLTITLIGATPLPDASTISVSDDPIDSTPSAAPITSTLTAPVGSTSFPAAPITSHPSVTTSTLLLPHPIDSEEPAFTVQTSVPPRVNCTSHSSFPSMSLPVINGTTTGVLYSASMTNSSLVHPTPFFPNATSAHSHLALPTPNVENRAAENQKVKGAAQKLGTSLVALAIGVVAVALVA